MVSGPLILLELVTNLHFFAGAFFLEIITKDAGISKLFKV